jgi:hypothetical protein
MLALFPVARRMTRFALLVIFAMILVYVRRKVKLAILATPTFPTNSATPTMIVVPNI